MDLMNLMTGFGLSTAAGGRASLIALLLGCFHYTEYFELGPSYVWLASPPVMCVLGVVAAAEMYIDSHPDLKDFAHYPSYLSSFIVGFIALSASTGEVDSNLLMLVGSGVLGGVTSSTMRFARNTVTEYLDHASEAVGSVLGDGVVNKKRSWLENAGTVGIGATSILLPFIVVGIVAILAVLFFWLRSKNKRATS